MNTKKFIVGGIVGGIVNYLLGWLLWGILFKDCFPPMDENSMNHLFIFLGCFTFAFFISYIFITWTSFSSPFSGAKAGIMVGLFVGLYNNFFRQSETTTPDYTMFLIDLGLMLLCGAVVGAIIALIHSKMK